MPATGMASVPETAAAAGATARTGFAGGLAGSSSGGGTPPGIGASGVALGSDASAESAASAVRTTGRRDSSQ